jgi:hypothetical protein
MSSTWKQAWVSNHCGFGVWIGMNIISIVIYSELCFRDMNSWYQHAQVNIWKTNFAAHKLRLSKLTFFLICNRLHPVEPQRASATYMNIGKMSNAGNEGTQQLRGKTHARLGALTPKKQTCFSTVFLINRCEPCPDQMADILLEHQSSIGDITNTQKWCWKSPKMGHLPTPILDLLKDPPKQQET